MEFRFEKAKVWIHAHPKTIKFLEITGLILGLGILSLPFLISTGLGLIFLYVIAGTFLISVSSLALYLLDICVPPHHDMKRHVYRPGQCEGGRLYYEGDVPILTLDSKDPFIAGKAHGYLCGDAISRLSKRFGIALHTLAKQPRAKQLPNTIAATKKWIPEKFLHEMEGIVVGYNQWAQEQYGWRFPNKLTLEDVILLHLIPDSIHFQPWLFEQIPPIDGEPQQLVFACSTLVDEDSKKGIVCARNMDWPSFGLAGTLSLVIHRINEDNLHTVEVGLPSFVGTLTGMNSHGLCVAMNVCLGHTEEVRGPPASLFNRACLEKCGSLNDVDGFISEQSPLGPYHLTVVDQKGAKAIHFYQSSENTHHICTWEKHQPLCILNERYSSSCGTPIFDKRQQMFDKFFQKRENRSLEDALSLPFVSNWITTHRVVMEPQNMTFKVAFNNAFAGNVPMRDVPIQKLFSTKQSFK